MIGSFYQNNAFKISNFGAFLDAENGAYQQIVDYTDQICRNFIIGQMETYRIVEYQTIDIADGGYTKVGILSNPEVASYLGYSSMPISERIAAWGAMPQNDKRKIDALDMAKNYISLMAHTLPLKQITDDAVLDNKTYEIVFFDLWVGNTKYQIGIDYDIRDNKLYLLSEDLFSIPENGTSEVTLRHIAVDYDTPTRYLGQNFQLPRYPDISKDLYNDILAKLTRAALGGYTIKNIKSGIDIVTGAEGSSAVIDQYSLSNTQRELWTSYEKTPFDFLVKLKGEYISSGSLADIMTRFIDTVKPAEAKYEMMVSSFYEDTYPRHIVASDAFSAKTVRTAEESYNYRTIDAQTNQTDRTTNSTFRTATSHGYAKYESGSITLRSIATGEEVVVVNF